MRTFLFLNFFILLIIISCNNEVTENPNTTTSSLTTSTTTTTLSLVDSTQIKLNSTSLGRDYTIDIYFPKEYSETTAKYKVLYANDGQDMTSVDLKGALTSLYESNTIEKIIVVAIHCSNDRNNDYGTIDPTTDNPITCQASSVNDNLGKNAKKYTDFLLENVMTHINSNYRTLTGVENTSIIGWSLGGLSAFSIAWAKPNVFGKVGVFSGSFWWRSQYGDLDARQNSRIMQNIISNSKKRDGLRMWFQQGSKDEDSDRDNDGIIDAMETVTDESGKIT
ncbi:MAG TPA: alpha/beta hydrolase-fold protein, partial [Spirochaetota bacterium]|nr:alpha/beta hydrolase-fold protein [Spirochaetota bacterium]